MTSCPGEFSIRPTLIINNNFGHPIFIMPLTAYDLHAIMLAIMLNLVFYFSYFFTNQPRRKGQAGSGSFLLNE